MILAIDVGNTNTVLGCIDGGRILDIVRIQTQIDETDVEYAIKMKSVFEFHHIDYSSFEGAILSSVVPAVTDSLAEATRMLTGIRPVIVRPGLKTGMNVKLDDPGTLAGDLVIGSVAAIEHYGYPSIVIDMGTATTIVFIDKDKCYRGGAIIPGLKLSLHALAAGTSLLPEISLSVPRKVIATNTVDSMRSGSVFGTIAMVDGMLDRMLDEIGYDCTIIATGGLASYIVPYCKHSIIYDDNLLLKGLWLLWNKNK